MHVAMAGRSVRTPPLTAAIGRHCMQHAVIAVACSKHNNDETHWPNSVQTLCNPPMNK